jgi:hypothetical protein
MAPTKANSSKLKLVVRYNELLNISANQAAIFRGTKYKT